MAWWTSRVVLALTLVGLIVAAATVTAEAGPRARPVKEFSVNVAETETNDGQYPGGLLVPVVTAPGQAAAAPGAGKRGHAH